VTEFKKKVLRTTIYIAAIFIFVAMIPLYSGILPWRYWKLYTVGVAFGTIASAVNFLIMSYCTQLTIEKGSKVLPAAGLLLRMVVYAGVFIGVFLYFGHDVYIEGLFSGIGAVLGFLTYLIAILWINAVYPAIKARRAARRTGNKKPEYIYEETSRDRNGRIRYVFVSSQSFDVWRGNKHYVTHKKFRKLHELRRAKDV
jgi:hypothetical protein